MDVINYTNPAPVVTTVERVVTNTKEVPVLPNRPLTQGEIDMLMWRAKAAHRERVVGTVMGTVGSLGIMFGFGWLIYKMYKLTEVGDDNADSAVTAGK